MGLLFLKFNKIMMVSLLLLAIMALGAVSATDELTANETPDFLELGVDDADIISEDVGDENLGDGLIDPEMTVTNLSENEVVFGDDIFIEVHLPENATGEVSFYVDGEMEDSYELSGYDVAFYQYFDHFGTYDFMIDYSGDDVYMPVNASFEYVLNDTQYRIGFDDPVEYGAEIVYVYAPYAFNGEVVVTVNGKRVNISEEYDGDMEETIRYFNASVLNYGENNITISSEGDDTFGAYNQQETLYLKFKMDAPDSFPFTSTDEAICVILPENANGTVTVISGHFEYDEDENEQFIEDFIFDSQELANGTAAIPLDSLDVGNYVFKLAYEGNLGIMDDICYMEVYPLINISTVPDENVTVTAKSSPNMGGNLTVFKEMYDDATDSSYLIEIAYAELENDTASVVLLDLSDGDFIEVCYRAGNYTYSVYEIIGSTDSDFEIEVEFHFANVIYHSESENEIYWYLPEYATGEVIILLDGQAADEITVDGDEYYYYELDTSGLDYGNHTVEVKYVSDEYQNSSAMMEFEVVSADIFIPDEIVYGEWYESIEVWVNPDATGFITVLLDGEQYENVTLEEGYIGYTFDIFDVPIRDYNITVIYSGDDIYMGVTDSKIVHLTYNIEISHKSIEYGDEEEYYVNIWVSEDIVSGEFLVTVDGESYEAILDDGILTVMTPDLSFGSHEIIVSYVGDEIYPALTVNDTIEVTSSITFPESFTIGSTGQNVSILLPEDANGTFTVYTGYLEGDIEYDEVEFIIVDELCSVEVEGGATTISLDDLEIGEYYIQAVYEGNYGIISDYTVFSVNPIVAVPRVMLYGDDAYARFEASEDMEGTFTVYMEVWNDDEEEYELIEIGSVEVENGVGEVLIGDLEVDEYSIYAEFISDDYEYGEYSMLYVLDSLDIDFEVEYDFTDILIDSEDEYSIYWELPEYAEGNVTVILDDEIIGVADVEETSAFYFYADDLDYGMHTLEVIFNSDVFPTYSDVKEFNVTSAVIIIPDEVVYGEWDESIEVWVNPDATGFITVLLDGEQYENVTLEEGFIGYAFDIFDVPISDYNVTVIYSGDDVYPGVSASKMVNLSYIINIYADIEYGDEDDYYVVFDVPEDLLDAEFNVTIDGESYNATLENGRFIVLCPDLSYGEHEIIVSYAGDEIYPACEFNDTVNVLSNIYVPEYWQNGDDIHLILPSDAKGKLIVDISSYYYDEDMDEEILTPYAYSQINLRNGKASYSLDNLEPGAYYIECTYSGNYGEMETVQYFMMVPDIYWENETKYEEYNFFPYGKNSTLIIETPEWSGQYIISIDRITAYDFFSVETEFVSAENVTLVNGNAFYNLPLLPLGDYIISVEDGEDTVFECVVYITPYEINVPEVINLNVKNNIIVVMPEDAVGNISVGIYALEYDEYWDEYYYELHEVVNSTIENGIGVVEIPELLDGEYAFVVYTTTENYGEYYEAFEEIIADYFPIDADLVVNVDDIEIGENETVTIEINRNITGKVTIDGEEVNVTDGRLDYVISNLTPGEHNITVAFEGDDVFNAVNYTATFKVSKLTPQIIITTGEAAAGENLEVNVEIAGATGTVTINGVDVALVDGKANITIENVTAGNLTVEVNYAGDDRFINATNSTTVEIKARKDAGLTVSVEDIMIGENATVNVQINERATGNVLVDGVEVAIANGTGSLVISGLAAGEHTVSVAFEGDDLFDDANATASFNVNKLTPTIDIVPGIAVEGEDLTLTVNIADATGNVAVNGETFELVDGKAIAVVKNMTLGDKIIRVSYSGDDRFTNAAESIRVTVNPKRDAGLKVRVSDIEVGENATVNVEINRAATGNVTVNGEKVEITSGKGSYIISGLAEGSYNVTVVFDGDKLFKASENGALFNVSKVILNPSADPFAVGNDSNRTSYTINMPSDATGNLTVTIANTTFTQELVNGTATVNVEGIPAGAYDATLAYTGDAKYSAIEKTVNATVRVDAIINASDVKVIYKAGQYFEVTVYGNDGNIAANTSVVFKVNGEVFATANTDANGTAGFKVTQIPGKYNVTAEALGVTATSKLTVKHLLKLKKVNVKRSANRLVLKAALKKVKGKYLKGKKITFKFKGKKYKVRTNKKGVAKVIIKSSVLQKLKVGKKVKYQATFKKDTVKKSAKVKK